jgi:hypothetical protein
VALSLLNVKTSGTDGYICGDDLECVAQTLPFSMPCYIKVQIWFIQKRYMRVDRLSNNLSGEATTCYSENTTRLKQIKLFVLFG